MPHLVDNQAKIVNERGWNLMCDRTLPSCLVWIGDQKQLEVILIAMDSARLCLISTLPGA